MEQYHKSVLLHEAVEALQVEYGKKYIDATLGGGGHTTEMLVKGGKVLALDVDDDAINYFTRIVSNKDEAHNILISQYPDITLVKGNFKDIDSIARERGFENVSGILFDLGVSSHQFDSSKRGFSFREDAFLDMRMDTSLGVSAKDLLAVLSKTELIKIFSEFGEEKFAVRIADAIVRRRQVKPVETTKELEALVRTVVPKGNELINPATRVFQALRIAVNTELENLIEALPKAYSLLVAKGRIVVISFHSLEDRIVKHMFSEWEKNRMGTIVTAKPIVPTEYEVAENSRSRSAKMRVFEKI